MSKHVNKKQGERKAGKDIPVSVAPKGRHSKRRIRAAKYKKNKTSSQVQKCAHKPLDSVTGLPSGHSVEISLSPKAKNVVKVETFVSGYVRSMLERAGIDTSILVEKTVLLHTKEQVDIEPELNKSPRELKPLGNVAFSKGARPMGMRNKPGEVQAISKGVPVISKSEPILKVSKQAIRKQAVDYLKARITYSVPSLQNLKTMHERSVLKKMCELIIDGKATVRTLVTSNPYEKGLWYKVWDKVALEAMTANI